MKTKDRLKEEIGLYKLLMTIVSAMFSSLVSWLFNNIKIAKKIEFSVEVLLLSMIAIFLLFVVIIFLTTINSKIKELDYE